MKEASALFGAYVSLLKVLHRNKVIDISDVVVDIGNTIDFAKIQHMDKEADQNYSVVLYDSLRQIAAAIVDGEEKIRQAKSGDE